MEKCRIFLVLKVDCQGRMAQNTNKNKCYNVAKFHAAKSHLQLFVYVICPINISSCGLRICICPGPHNSTDVSRCLFTYWCQFYDGRFLNYEIPTYFLEGPESSRMPWDDAYTFAQQMHVFSEHNLC